MLKRMGAESAQCYPEPNLKCVVLLQVGFTVCGTLREILLNQDNEHPGVTREKERGAQKTPGAKRRQRTF